MSQGKHFVSMMTLGRLDSHEDMTAEEAQIFRAHVDYLEQQFREGRILFAGPSTEGRFAVVVLETATKEAAAEIMNADPAVAAGILKSEVHDFDVFLMRGVTEV